MENGVIMDSSSSFLSPFGAFFCCFGESVASSDMVVKHFGLLKDRPGLAQLSTEDSERPCDVGLHHRRHGHRYSRLLFF